MKWFRDVYAPRVADRSSPPASPLRSTGCRCYQLGRAQMERPVIGKGSVADVGSTTISKGIVVRLEPAGTQVRGTDTKIVGCVCAAPGR
ncbi:hypothetical protein ACFVW5_20990 [Streptomyces sp. NPDC058232]|uniref:hypothetical protein n=1 Tax=unclassified Streptomyces TaxID=2593676 RepID=UPI0036ED7B55